MSESNMSRVGLPKVHKSIQENGLGMEAMVHGGTISISIQADPRRFRDQNKVDQAVRDVFRNADTVDRVSGHPGMRIPVEPEASGFQITHRADRHIPSYAHESKIPAVPPGWHVFYEMLPALDVAAFLGSKAESLKSALGY